MDDVTTLRADVIVAGAGIGGLTAAGSAQEAGAKVVLLEKAPTIGGSAAVSGGTVWCAANLDAWLSVQPDAEPALGKALIDNFLEGIDWLREQGVAADRLTDEVPYKFERVVYALRPDARSAMDTLAQRITAGGGAIYTRARLRDLRLDSRGRVSGVLALGPDGFLDVSAPSVVLATGGFQGNPDLRARYLGRWSDRMGSNSLERVLNDTRWGLGDHNLPEVKIAPGGRNLPRAAATRP